MLTMTAPMGRRRISAAISASVGRRARRGSWAGVGSGSGSGWGSGGRGGAAWRSAGGLPAAGIREGDGVRSLPRAARWLCGFEGGGATQAAGDAGDDERNVGGAEGFGEEPEIRGGGALMGCGGELLAEVDQPADEEEDAVEGGGYGWGVPGWIGVGGRGRGVGGGGHERT